MKVKTNKLIIILLLLFPTSIFFSNFNFIEYIVDGNTVKNENVIREPKMSFLEE